jgi:competence protein ComEA
MSDASSAEGAEGADVDEDAVAYGSGAASTRRRPPDTLRGGRLALDGWAVGALAAIALAGVVVAAWFAWRGASTQTPIGPAALLAPGIPVARSATASAATTAGPSQGSVLLVVDVAGRVRRPGLVRLPPGARVADALAAAGGVLPGVDLATINLARPVVDGEQVLVGLGGVVAGGAGPGGMGAGGAGAGGAGGTSGPIDLNGATLEQLESLPGVGPVLAQRILDWRQAHGHFSSVDELREVGGIGERKFADIEPKVRV